MNFIKLFINSILILFIGICCFQSQAMATVGDFNYASQQQKVIEEKDILEATILNYGDKLSDLQKYGVILQGKVEWLELKIERIQDQNREVPYVLDNALSILNLKLDNNLKEIGRLTNRLEQKRARLNKLDQDVRSNYKGTPFENWWQINPQINIDNHKMPAATSEEPQKVAAQSTPQTEAAPVLTDNILQLRQELEDRIQAVQLNDWLEMKANENGVWIINRLPILFGRGKTNIADEYKSFFSKMVALLEPYDVKIQIEGYTDKTKVRKSNSNNWVLSAKRAANVAEQFVKNGMSPDDFTIIGRGEFGTSFYNYASKNTAMDRRVEVTVSFLNELKKNRNTN